MAKILTPINLGPLQFSHRVVVKALPSGSDALSRPNDPRGGLILQPFEPSADRATVARDRAWRYEDCSTIAQLSCTTATTAHQSERHQAAWRDLAMQAAGMPFDGAELDAPGALPSLPTLLDRVQILIEVWGADRVGVQITPFAWLPALDDQRPAGVLSDLLAELSDMEIAYVHLAGAVVPGRGDLLASPLGRHLRTAYPGILIASGGFTPSTAIAAVERRWADMIGFPSPTDDGDDPLAAVEKTAR